MHPLLIPLLIPFLLLLRIILLLPARQRPSSKRRAGDTCSLGVFLGSGGHTAEMKTLLSTLDFDRYTPRTYVYCPGDDHSLRLIKELEQSKGSDPASYTFLPLPRARRVAQSLGTSIFTTLGTFLVAFTTLFILPLLRHPFSPWVDVLLVNGPGTCVVVVAVSWVRRILGLGHTRIVYIESFARVSSLSLSAKILRPFVDSFVVQWPQLAGDVAGARVTMGSDRSSASATATPTPRSGSSGGGLIAHLWRGRTAYKGWLV